MGGPSGQRGLPRDTAGKLGPSPGHRPAQGGPSFLGVSARVKFRSGLDNWPDPTWPGLLWALVSMEKRLGFSQHQWPHQPKGQLQACVHLPLWPPPPEEPHVASSLPGLFRTQRIHTPQTTPPQLPCPWPQVSGSLPTWGNPEVGRSPISLQDKAHLLMCPHDHT